MVDIQTRRREISAVVDSQKNMVDLYARATSDALGQFGDSETLDTEGLTLDKEVMQDGLDFFQYIANCLTEYMVRWDKKWGQDA